MSEADIARFAKLYPTTLGPESQPALHSGCDAALTTPPACMTSRSLLLRVEGTRSISEDDVERYESRWPIGTKERVWLGGLLYSGLRRGDAASRRFALIRTGITVTIPILPALDEVLQAGPCGDLIFICGENDRSLTKEPSGNLFREACNAAGVAKSAHGVRKIGATRAANNGAYRC
jgi:hypothetical protein